MSPPSYVLPTPEEARALLRARVFPWTPQTLFAPMEGVSHPALRDLVSRRGGVGVVCTEFVRVTRNPLGDKTIKKHVVRPSASALSVQVMGNDIEQMAEATEMVTRAGADIVDINLGCPAPKAVRKGVGSAMLKDRALLSQVVRAMRERTHLPLSAKMRAGYEDQHGVLDIARTLEDAGVDFLTVHPRRRIDFYDGVADWRIIARLVEALGIVVVGNGDIWNADDALRMRRETGCHAVMIGRPLLRNPWIFRQIQAIEQGRPPEQPTGQQVLDYYSELIAELSQSYESRAVTGFLKEQLRYLGRAVPDGLVFLKTVCREPTPSAILACMTEMIGGRGAQELDLTACSRGIEPRGSVAAEPQVAQEAPTVAQPRASEAELASDTAMLL